MMSLSVALLLMLTFLFFWKLAKWKLVPRLNYPRSLPSLPIIGSLLQLAGQPQVHLLFHRLQQKYGNLYSLYMGSHYVVVVNNYLHAKEVLLKKGKIFAGRPRMVTTDLLTRNGKDIAFATYSPLWKFQRKLVHSALSMFGKGSLALEKIICQEAASLCGILNVTQESSLDIASELTRAVTNVVCNLCFKSSYHRGDAEFEAMLQYSQGIVDTVAKEGLVDIFPWLQSFPNKDLALLKQCVAMRDQLLYQQFAKHKVQQKIQDELDQKVGYNRNPQLSDRLHMTYLEATISEVLRIRPVSPLLIPHEALEDTSIGEYDIPKGARIVINLWSIHHDEKEWDKPGEFNPGRFLDESGNHIYSPSPSYLPFGAGVRVCMGEVLAKMELFLFMAWILQRFTLSIPEGHTLPEPEGKFGVVLQVPNFKVKATLRKAWEGLEVDQ
ncbi:steroid 17-alpha-hydroxylase/17,20 lyase isoform X2 [Hemicordylus capensis]|uniref:steroid 17-alpha-hydroxylase/17,20 lyase isoform X2 n=1 Tax=Hemicordylus capensis TaxID=884348 RepID=UPI002304C981|nr:steroid 17-alpha-hydroxylase/17,20 lyase isoform X2 [Hemicordylus capensis]